MSPTSLGPKLVRMIAFDPTLFDGRRVHEAAGWYSPQSTLVEFVRALNWSAQEEIYQPEGGSAASAIWYMPTIPYQPISAQYGPFAQDPTFPVVHLEAEEFVRRLGARGPWPYDGMEQGNAYLASILDRDYVGFDLVADANASRFHLLIIYAPGGGSDEGGYHGLAESWMFHAADDPTGYGVNAGQFEPAGDSPAPDPQPPEPNPQPPTPPDPDPDPQPPDPAPPSPPTPPSPGPDHRMLYSLPLQSGEGVGLRHDRKFVALYANATRAVDALLHSWGHAHIDNGVLGTIWDHDNKEIQSPLALWMQIDDLSVQPIGHTNEAHCGDVHHLPNSFQGDYSYDDADIVPSNADVWLDYPNRGPWADGVLNLGNNSRRKPVGQFSWRSAPAPPLAPWSSAEGGIDAFPSYVRSYVWRYRRLPRGSGLVDGRHADWWRYLVDVNEQAGRGLPVTSPTKPASTGTRDLTLTVLESNADRCRVGIFWQPSSVPSTTFALLITGEPGHGTVTYEILGSFDQTRGNFELELPPDGVPRFFVLIWQRPHSGGVLISDVLGVIPGTSSGAQPLHPSISLLQSPIPYLRCDNPGPSYRLGFSSVRDDNQIFTLVPLKTTPAQVSCCFADVWTTESRYAIGLTDTGGKVVGRSDTLLVMRGWSQV